MTGENVSSGNHVLFDDISLIINQSNDAAPTIEQTISNQEITVGDPLGPFNFTINDTDTNVSLLSVTAASSNQTLLPDSNITLGGSGSNRSISLSPSAGQTGETDITITVSDGIKTAQTSFHLKIDPVATLGANLVINGDASQTITSTCIPGWSGADWSRFVTSGNKFTVSTVLNPGDKIYIYQDINVSSRHTLIDSGFLNFQASAGLRNGAELIVTGINQYGSTLWTEQTINSSGSTQTLTINKPIPANTYYIRVTVGGPLNAQISIVSLIIPDDLPKITAIAGQTIYENHNTGAISFDVGYIASSITLSGSSSDSNLVPDANIVFGGSGMQRTVTVTPNPDISGNCSITITANDGSKSGTTIFPLTVNPIPRVSSVAVPAGGTYGAGNNLDFTINFNTPVTVDTATGTPYICITLDSGGAVNASYMSNSSPNALLFGYTVATGDLDLSGITVGGLINTNGGTIRNAAGYDAVLALSNVGDASSVKVDGVAPAVDDANPAAAYSALTHTLIVKITERGGIAAGQGGSAVDAGKFIVWSGGASRTLDSGQSSAAITDSSTVTIIIGGTDLAAVQAFAGGEKLNRVDVSAGSITDAAGNANIDDSNNTIFTIGVSEVVADKAALAITYGNGDNSGSVTQDLTLPASGANGTAISWQSSDTGIITNDGMVTRPSNSDASVTLTATVSISGISDTKTFPLTVKISDEGAVAADKAALAITYGGGDNSGCATQNLTLPASGANGTTISWQSSNTNIIANDGTVARPSDGDASATLTATISKNGINDTKVFPVTVRISDAGAVAVDKAALAITYGGSDYSDNVTQNVILPVSGANGTTISWQSSGTNIIANDGTVARPSNGDAHVTLTATVSKGGIDDTKVFLLTVTVNDAGAVTLDKAALAITFAAGDSAGSVTQSVYLPATGAHGSIISWQSSDTGIITNDGTVYRPSNGDTDVTLTAAVSKNGNNDTKAFPVTVKITDAGAVAADKAALAISFASGDSAGSVTQSVYLPAAGVNGTAISWQSGGTNIIANDGTVYRPSFTAGNADVTVTASIFKGGVTDNKQFLLTVVKLPINDTEAVAADKTALALTFAPGDSAGSVTQSVYLPAAGAYGTAISWQSGNTNIIGNDGTVYRPTFTAGNTDVTVTASVYRNQTSDTVQFNLIVLKLPANDQESVSQATYGLEIGYTGSDRADQVTNNITLASTGANGTAIIWTSSDPAVVSGSGTVTRPAFTSGDVSVTLTAIISKGSINETKQFTVTVKKLPASGNADLSGIMINGVTLVPSFSQDNLFYTANVGNGTSSIVINLNPADSAASVKVNGNPANGSAAVALNVGTNNIIIEVTAQDGTTKKTYTLSVNRSGSSNNSIVGSNNNSANGTATTPQNPVTTTVDAAGKVTVTATMDKTTGTVSTQVNSEALTSAFDKAKNNEAGVKTVTIEVPRVEGAKAYDSTLPVSFLTAGDNTKLVEIKTDIAVLTMPGNMLTEANDAKSISLNIGAGEKTKLDADVQTQIGDRPLIELSLKIDGKPAVWSNESAPVTVSVPYTPTDEEKKDPGHITVWYIDGSGKVVSVPSGRYDPATGRVTFSTNHFSYYAVVYVQKTFEDIASYAWAKKEIEVLAAKGVINGTTVTTFAPSANITRADFITLLVRTLGLTASVDGNYEDVKPGDYYYEALGIAKKLGIASGTGNGMFNPGENITRQDMMVLTVRALMLVKKLKQGGIASGLEKFADKDMIADYAADSVAMLVNENLISGSGDRINPLDYTTRAEAAMLLYRIYNK